MPKNNKPLKYTEYKKKQAMWLQRQDIKRFKNNRSINTEQFCINLYKNYLELIGYKNEKVFTQIAKYIDNVGTYHLDICNESYNKGYDEKIANNINELMDELI